MVVSATLAAVLMAAVLSVLTTLARDRRRMTSEGRRGQSESTVVLDLIRADLVDARTLVQGTDGNRVKLTGPMLTDPARLVPTGRLADVTYEVVPPDGGEGGGGGWLVRRQRSLDDPREAGKTWSELVAVGVASLSFTPEPPPQANGGAAVAAAKSSVDAIASGGPPSLGRVRVRLTWRDARRPPIDAMVVSW
jgi:hypothetical protein